MIGDQPKKWVSRDWQIVVSAASIHPPPGPHAQSNHDRWLREVRLGGDLFLAPGSRAFSVCIVKTNAFRMLDLSHAFDSTMNLRVAFQNLPWAAIQEQSQTAQSSLACVICPVPLDRITAPSLACHHCRGRFSISSACSARWVRPRSLDSVFISTPCAHRLSNLSNILKKFFVCLFILPEWRLVLYPALATKCAPQRSFHSFGKHFIVLGGMPIHRLTFFAKLVLRLLDPHPRAQRRDGPRPSAGLLCFRIFETETSTRVSANSVNQVKPVICCLISPSLAIFRWIWLSGKWNDCCTNSICCCQMDACLPDWCLVGWSSEIETTINNIAVHCPTS